MDDDQQFCLRWNNHQSTLISVFDTLLENGTLVDCTLAAEGKFLKAHKVVLSACSPYFATLLSQQYDKHPIFILKDVKFQELRAMMDYMYRGEVNISQDQLAALLKAAESLQIKGLSDSRSGGNNIGGGVGGSGGLPKSVAEHKPLSVPVASAAMKGASPSGYTIEQKRSRHAIGGPSSIESQSGSREGSSSPTTRKRKKIRRRSIDNINADNHEHSNSSSQSIQINSSVPQSNTSATAITSSVQGAVASQSISATQQQQQQQQTVSLSGGAAGSGSGLNVTKKTDSVSSNTKLETAGTEHDLDTENGDEQDDNIIAAGTGKSINLRKEQNIKRKQHAAAIAAIDSDGTGKDGGELLIEPKSEYEEGNDETVEDLTLDDEELLEDLDQAGPSHGGGEGSSQGYAQWQVDRSQDDVFMATQEGTGQQRDPQGAYWTILETVPLQTTTATSGTGTGVHTDCSNLITQATVVVQIPSNAAHHLQYDGKVAKVEEVVFENATATTTTISAAGTMQTVSDVTVTEEIEDETTVTGTIVKSEEYKLMTVPQKTETLNIQQMQYMCNKCGKSYKIKGSLKRHISYECGISPGLACKFCKHKSKYKSDLRKHMIQRHSDQNLDGF